MGICYETNSQPEEAIRWLEYCLYHPETNGAARVREIEKRLSTIKPTTR